MTIEETYADWLNHKECAEFPVVEECCRRRVLAFGLAVAAEACQPQSEVLARIECLGAPQQKHAEPPQEEDV